MRKPPTTDGGYNSARETSNRQRTPCAKLSQHMECAIDYFATAAGGAYPGAAMISFTSLPSSVFQSRTSPV